jgi:hypothetical protein
MEVDKMAKKMADAYKAAASLMSSEMEKYDQQAARAIGDLKQTDIVVVRGDYDKIEDVLQQAGTPCTVIGPRQLGNYGLSPEQVVFVNCLSEGKVAAKGIGNLRRYVEKGGYLTTTDWALKAVVEKAFPGYVKHNGITTRNDVVKVHLCGKNAQFLAGLQGKSLKPQWWLEGSSYPIEILDKKNVEVLIDSSEMKRKYNDSPIVVTFDHGQGKVIHMVSHYYLQQSKAGRRGMTAKQFAEDILGLSAKEVAGLEGKLDGLSADQVEAAFASSRFVHNIVAGKKKG